MSVLASVDVVRQRFLSPILSTSNILVSRGIGGFDKTLAARWGSVKGMICLQGEPIEEQWLAIKILIYEKRGCFLSQSHCWLYPCTIPIPSVEYVRFDDKRYMTHFIILMPSRT